jgi:hypothetical protein
VDAECTHDGSAKHVAKAAGLESRRLEGGLLNPQRLAGLAELQRGLIRWVVRGEKARCPCAGGHKEGFMFCGPSSQLANCKRQCFPHDVRGLS